jgi:hypothetical protein
MIYTAAAIGLLAGCSASQEGPLAPADNSPWVDYPANTVGVLFDKERGEIVLQSDICPIDERARYAVAFLPDGGASFGCWVDMAGQESDYVFIGWTVGPGAEPYPTARISAYKFSSIKWSEMGKALIDAGKTLQGAGK